MGKFDSKANERIFLGYVAKSKGYRVFNKKSMIVKESITVLFDELNSHIASDNDDEDARKTPKATEGAADDKNYLKSLPKKIKFMPDHPKTCHR